MTSAPPARQYALALAALTALAVLLGWLMAGRAPRGILRTAAPRRVPGHADQRIALEGPGDS